MPASINLDPHQSKTLKILYDISAELSRDSFFIKWLNPFAQNRNPLGLYLHGGVGRGKTMLMKMFYDQLNFSKKIVHYQSFMQELHKEVHKVRNGSQYGVLEDIATNIAKRSRIICIDEFEIKDITDAMIIQRLFEYLIKKRVFIFITTNTEPSNLYKDGLQRELFMPFIKLVQNKFLVISLDSDKDYRFENVIENTKRVMFPINNKVKSEMKNIIEGLCKTEEISPGSIKVFGRDVFFQRTHQNILFTNFSELFMQDLGYADYVNISQSFRIIILEDVRKIEENETDIVTRFINFIDNAYFYKVLLFISLDQPPEEIYKVGKRRDEFARTISRLREMNSQDYLTKISND